MDTENPTLLHRRRRRFRLEMNGTTLKTYACITMVFYTASMSVIQNGMIHVNEYTAQELSDALSADPDLMMLSGWASVFQLIGGLACSLTMYCTVYRPLVRSTQNSEIRKEESR